MKKKLFLFLLIASALFVGCFEDNDDNIVAASSSEINDFIYRGLNFFYLFKADTPELADNFFTSNDDYANFLNSYDTPESFFAYLKSNQDRFSILVDDYIELENSLSGISKNNGMEFGLVLYPDGSNNVFGYIRYVLPNTDAAAEGLERGMIFNTVNGTQITAFDDGNGNLIIDNSIFSADTYTIGLATFDGTNVTPTGENVELTKAEYTENPIFVNRVIERNGIKIGYLMYNAFTSEFNNELNQVFGNFVAEGVTELVVDLRYNGGGSVLSSTYLASMITGQFTGQTYYTEQWNAERQGDYAEDGVFVDQISGGGGINSLNLNKVYILTTSRTASASELVINGLNPYIDVVQIGDNTTGKYQASFLLYDAPAPNFSRAQVNPNHTYALLPLVFQTANANGFTNFENGLVPDIPLDEDFANLGVLGNESEPLLAAALADIEGVPMPFPDFTLPTVIVSESKALLPTYQKMILTPKNK